MVNVRLHGVVVYGERLTVEHYIIANEGHNLGHIEVFVDYSGHTVDYIRVIIENEERILDYIRDLQTTKGLS